MIGDILFVLVFLMTPAAVLALCRRISILGKIGPILILYILGIIIGNSGIRAPHLAEIQDVLSSTMVPLAIPLMLFSCTFRMSETRSQILALVTGIVAVLVSVTGGYFIFGRQLPDGANIGGMLMGVYTGGTINLASLKTMLGVSEETFILLNSYDMIISFLYLSFLLAVGVRLFRRWLPNISNKADGASDIKSIRREIDKCSDNPYKGMFSRRGMKDVGIQASFTLAIIAISAALGLVAGDGIFMTIFILSLTTLSIGASFLKYLKGRRYGYDIGMYCIYVFSIVVASMADATALDISGGLRLLGYLTFVIFVSLMLQLLFAKLFKIDSDTTVVSSVAFICSPPFVPMMAGAMRNKNVLASGLAIGIIGYAAGNYLGWLVSLLLQLF